MFPTRKKSGTVIYRFEDLEKRRRSTWVMSVMLLISLGAGFFLTLIPTELGIRPLFGTLPVLRIGLMVLLALLSVYIVRNEVENSRLMRELWDKKVNIDGLNQRVMELSVLHDVSAAINSMLDMDKVTDLIMDSAFKLMPAEMGAVILAGESEGTFRIVTSRGLGGHAPHEVTAGDSESVLTRVWREGRVAVLSDAEADDLLAVLTGPDQRALSAICAPLKQKGRVTGLFCLGNFSYKDSFDQRDADLLAIFADQVAIALENARLFHNLEQSLAELKDAQAKMVQTGKLAAVGQLAAGVAHELNNPIVGILGYSQYALEKIRGKEPSQLSVQDLENYAKYVGYIEHESQRCKVIIQNLLNFSRKGTAALSPTDVNKVLETTFALLAHQMQMHNVKLESHLSADLPPVWGNGTQLQQVFMNVMINAQKAMAKGGTLTVTSRSRLGLTREDAGVEVLFTDTGCGIAPEHLSKIFDPFFTTRKVGEGTGLGLSLSHGIIKNHGGEIGVESVVGRGTTFTILLPSAREAKPGSDAGDLAHSLAVGQAG